MASETRLRRESAPVTFATKGINVDRAADSLRCAICCKTIGWRLLDIATMMTRPITRRSFVQAGLVGGVGALAGCRLFDDELPFTLDAATLDFQVTQPTVPVDTGFSSFTLGSRGGFLYIPPSYQATTPAPLAVLLHGARQGSGEWASAPLDKLVDDLGIILVAVDSDGPTWDLIDRGGFGPDVARVTLALHHASDRCNIDGSRIALCGFSDGASYALSLGAANGQLLSRLVAFSPGIVKSPGVRGKPGIFISHGRQDAIIPFSASADIIVPSFEAEGYDVTFWPFDGPHVIPFAGARAAFESLAKGAT